MSAWWGDVNARARGLATRLPAAADLRALAESRSLPELGRGLAARGIELTGMPVTAGEMDASLRRWVGNQLRPLRRRLGHRRSEAARIVVEDEDRRAARRLVRGAVEGAPAATRLAGLVPSPLLPARALERLARSSSLAELGDRLTRLGHPAREAIVRASGVPVPDLFRLEAELDRVWADRALAGVRRGGDLLDFVRESLDLMNAGTVLVLAGTRLPLPTADLFLTGGRSLTRTQFEAALAGEAEESRRTLRRAFADGPLEAAFEGDGGTRETGELERRVLGLRSAAWGRRALTAPIGPAPFLAYALRLRACAMDLSRLVWGCALRAPPARRVAGAGRTS